MIREADGRMPFESARILIVEDEDLQIRLLRRIFEAAGFTAVAHTRDPSEVADLCTASRPDLILLDLHMDPIDGFGVLEQLRDHIESETYLPVLMLTGDHDPDVLKRALACGAKDFLTKPFDAGEVLLRSRNLLETRFLHRRLREQNVGLEWAVRQRTRHLSEARIEVIQRLARAAEYRDDETGEHTRRVGQLAAEIAHVYGLLDEAVDRIGLTAPLHDVGKIAIPDTILLKPGPLDESEWAIMKHHTILGAKILGGSASKLLQMGERIAISHHEHWDGQGYPNGLAGEAIPIEGRIVAVADVYDALTHDRPYRSAWDREQAMAHIEGLRGTHFDPDVVKAFVVVEHHSQRFPSGSLLPAFLEEASG